MTSPVLRPDRGPLRAGDIVSAGGRYLLVVLDEESPLGPEYPDVRVAALSEALEMASDRDLLLPADVWVPNPGAGGGARYPSGRFMVQLWNTRPALTAGLEGPIARLTASALDAVRVFSDWLATSTGSVPRAWYGTSLTGPSDPRFDFQRQELRATAAISAGVLERLAAVEGGAGVERRVRTDAVSERAARWTNASVRRFASGRDPVAAVTERARQVVTEALDAGWSGPPFDPLGLADHLQLSVVPRDDVRDARTVADHRGRARIEFNPNRPRGRMRYSIAHEIAHTFFPDFAERVRHRASHADMTSDEWQLEALCNIAAAEILMPLGSLPLLTADDLTIDGMLALQRIYDVSTEALLIRVIRVADAPCAMFCASQIAAGTHKGRYRLDYVIGSRAWDIRLPRGFVLPSASIVTDCRAIGARVTGDEEWAGPESPLHVECVGIPPYPGSILPRPRVVGILTPAASVSTNEQAAAHSCIVYTQGNAVEPQGTGPKIIVHVVNDATATWGGGGFAAALRRRFPSVQEDFQDWAAQSRALSLGRMRLVRARPKTWVATLVAQKGYGPSAKPRIRYVALREALGRLAGALVETPELTGARVHMPRIGCGQAGGSWEVVRELILETLCAAGVHVTVYDLPGTVPASPAQRALELSGA